jgi:hypothetical protein
MTYTSAECTVNKLLMMGRGTARNMWSFTPEKIWKIGTSGWFYYTINLLRKKLKYFLKSAFMYSDKFWFTPYWSYGYMPFKKLSEEILVESGCELYNVGSITVYQQIYVTDVLFIFKIFIPFLYLDVFIKPICQ